MTSGHLIDATLAFALVVVVPSAIGLLHRAERAETATIRVVGAVCSTSFLVAEGLGAAALVVPWLGATGLIAFREVRNLVRERRVPDPTTIAALYLVAGACWLAVSRYGARPLGFSDEIVALTAVHFHYAGFVASLVTNRLAEWLDRARKGHSRTGRVCVYAVLAATPITAAGITLAEWLGAAGATLFALSLTTASILTIVVVLPNVRGRARLLLGVSSLSVMGTMVLAVAYALGRWLPTPVPSLETMVWTHGLLNALGFSLCGILGWSIVQRWSLLTKSTNVREVKLAT